MNASPISLNLISPILFEHCIPCFALRVHIMGAGTELCLWNQRLMQASNIDLK